MTLTKAVILGALQGVAEFLPISSSGHLVIISHLLGAAGEGDTFFPVVLHLGSMLAIVIAYYEDVLQLIAAFFVLVRDLFTGQIRRKRRSGSRNYLYMLIISLLPLLLVLPFRDRIYKVFSSPMMVGGCLLLTGCILWVSRMAEDGTTGMADMRPVQALLVGISQTVAVIPGISRSGTTVAVAMLAGLRREFAVRFSLMMSLPTILAAFVLEFWSLLRINELPKNLAPYLAGAIAAAITGFLAIRILRGLVRSNRLHVFSYYCFVVGAATLIYFRFLF